MRYTNKKADSFIKKQKTKELSLAESIKFNNYFLKIKQGQKK
jgi:hypothetical protein